MAIKKKNNIDKVIEDKLALQEKHNEKRKKQIQEIEEAVHLDLLKLDLNSQLNRARAVSVGTSFGGTTEISMRGPDGKVLWCHLQPVEVTELIHQLSANIGCHIHIQPRKDFSSWREWKENTGGFQWPPFPNDLFLHYSTGTTESNSLPKPEEQAGLRKLENKEIEKITLDQENKKTKKIKGIKNETLAT